MFLKSDNRRSNVPLAVLELNREECTEFTVSHFGEKKDFPNECECKMICEKQSIKKLIIITFSCRIQSYVSPESSLSEERKRELERREQEMDGRERELEREKEADRKERQLEREKEMDRRERQLEREKEMDRRERQLEREKEMDRRERQLEREKEMDRKERQLETEKEMDRSERERRAMELDKREKEMDRRERQQEGRKKEMDRRERELKRREQEMDRRERELKRREQEMDRRERERAKELDKREEEIWALRVRELSAAEASSGVADRSHRSTGVMTINKSVLIYMFTSSTSIPRESLRSNIICSHGFNMLE